MYHEPKWTDHGHACPQCGGKGRVRVVGRPAYEQVPCPRCGGSGTLKPKRD